MASILCSRRIEVNEIHVCWKRSTISLCIISYGFEEKKNFCLCMLCFINNNITNFSTQQKTQFQCFVICSLSKIRFEAVTMSTAEKFEPHCWVRFALQNNYNEPLQIRNNRLRYPIRKMQTYGNINDRKMCERAWMNIFQLFVRFEIFFSLFSARRKKKHATRIKREINREWMRCAATHKNLAHNVKYERSIPASSEILMKNSNRTLCLLS